MVRETAMGSNEMKNSHLSRSITKAEEVVEEKGQDLEYMIKCRSKFKLYWDIIIITAAIYNSIVIPVEIAFIP